MSDHLTNELVAAYLEREISTAEHQQIELHLAKCLSCQHQLADVTTLLKQVDLLCPTVLDHPLERLLAPLRRVIPIPVWAWNVALVSLTFVLWISLLDISVLPWRYSITHTLAALPALLLMSTHLMWLQPHLRKLVRDLWRGGASQANASSFNRRLGWLQGWPFGGVWLFVVLALAFNLANLLVVLNTPWEWFKETAIGFYTTIVLTALYWGWGWGGALLHSLTEILRHQPELQSLPVVAQARRLAAVWVVVASLCVTWNFIFHSDDSAMQPLSRLWDFLTALVVLALWFGYTRLELCLVQKNHQTAWHWDTAVRLMVTLALVIIPLGLIIITSA